MEAELSEVHSFLLSSRNLDVAETNSVYFLPEKFAESNCEILLSSSGPFAACHQTVNPKFYHEVCDGLAITAFRKKILEILTKVCTF
jgi:hypothetical protein